MKNLSKVVFLCLVSLMIFASCDQNSGILPSDAITIDNDNAFIEPVGEEEDFNAMFPYEYTGYVVSEYKSTAINNATVEVYEIAKNSKKLSSVVTDSNGKFSLKLKDDITKVTIKVNKAGFINKTIKLTDLDENTIWLAKKDKPVAISTVSNLNSTN